MTDLASSPEAGSQPQHVKRPSRRCRHAEKQLHEEQRNNKRPGDMKAPKGPPLRRSKRLRV